MPPDSPCPALACPIPAGGLLAAWPASAPCGTDGAPSRAATLGPRPRGWGASGKLSFYPHHVLTQSRRIPGPRPGRRVLRFTPHHSWRGPAHPASGAHADSQGAVWRQEVAVPSGWLLPALQEGRYTRTMNEGGAEVRSPVSTRAGGHGESGPRHSPHRLTRARCGCRRHGPSPRRPECQAVS